VKEPAVESITKFVEIALEMFGTKTMECAINESFGIADGHMQPFEMFRILLRIESLGK